MSPAARQTKRGRPGLTGTPPFYILSAGALTAVKRRPARVNLYSMAILRAGKFFRFSLMTAVFLRILGKMPCARRARKGETAMSAKSTAPDLAGYRAWLQARECSAGTVEKYLRDVARFFAEAEAQSPAPKEAAAAFRRARCSRGAAGSRSGASRSGKC